MEKILKKPLDDIYEETAERVCGGISEGIPEKVLEGIHGEISKWKLGIFFE